MSALAGVAEVYLWGAFIAVLMRACHSVTSHALHSPQIGAMMRDFGVEIPASLTQTWSFHLSELETLKSSFD